MAHYDALIIGSGFGGGVMAYRLAEAGLRVAVLERGKKYPPGSFPRTAAGMRKNFWDPENNLFGLFQPWSFTGMEVVTGSGLGGGSLIYANALIRKTPESFGADWPIRYRDLESSYAEAEKMLGATPYPFSVEPYKNTPKTLAMRDASFAIGTKAMNWGFPNLAIRFGDDPSKPRPGEPIREKAGEENLHGAFRRTCTLCGECDLGCNDGAKNTVDLNYLSAAQRLGAEIVTGHDAKKITPRANGGYEVEFEDLSARMLDPSRPVGIVTHTADRVIVSAGTFGSSYLLMKNVERGTLKIGSALGTRYSGNGDILSFVMNVKDANGALRSVDPCRGPVLTSTFYGDRFIIQDGGFPPMLSWMVEISQVPALLMRVAKLAAKVVAGWFGLRPDTNIAEELSAALGNTALSDATLVLLGMGLDVADGKLSLDGKYLEMAWKPTRSEEHFQRVLAAAKTIADAVNGELAINPSWKLGRVVTPHPLGGAPMGLTKDTGVVNAEGEVFGHPGLYVADGSVMPGAIGPNPSLTIAATSNHFADRMLLKISTHRPIRPRPGAGAAKVTPAVDPWPQQTPSEVRT